MDELGDLRMMVARARGWKFYELTPTPDNDADLPHRDRTVVDLFPPGWVNENNYWTAREVDWPDNWQRVAARFSMPHYGIEWAAAGELVEEMRGSGFQLYEPEPVDGAPKNWCCCLYMDGAGTIAEAYADTAPEAICRAYLAWKEAQHVR